MLHQRHVPGGFTDAEGDDPRTMRGRARGHDLDAQPVEPVDQLIGERPHVARDHVRPDAIYHAHRRAERDRPRIVRGTADFPGPRLLREGVVANGRDGRRLEVLAEASAGRLDREVAVERGSELAPALATDVHEAAAERRVEPLVPTAQEQVDRGLAHVDGHGAELLDGVHDEPHAALATQRTDGVEVGAKAIRPLHRAQHQRTGARPNQGRQLLHPDRSVFVPGHVHADSVPLAKLDPGYAHLHELEVGEQHAVALGERQ